MMDYLTFFVFNSQKSQVKQLKPVRLSNFANFCDPISKYGPTVVQFLDRGNELFSHVKPF